MKKAFTLIELILASALIGLLAFLTVPIYQSYLISTQRETASQEIVSKLHRARLKAMGSENDSSWSVAIGNDQNITLFRGSNYVSRDQNFDESIHLPTTLIASGINLVTFLKESGAPSASGTITIRDTASVTQEITIESNGTVTF